MNQSEPASCCRCAAPLSPGVPGALCAACLGGDLFSDDGESLPFSRIGDYELLEEIGRGGMGLVYRARQISLNRPAAVKLILTGPLASVVERQRFVAEASAAAALDHPAIVAVYEAGEEDGQPFFAMQHIEGASLSDRLKSGGRYAPRDAAELIRRTALAVQHAHERGFLHRDLKPGNILLDGHGAPHVTDFGLARRLDDDSRLTLTGSAVGTPSYMAPEQTDTRRPPTTAVDVYSLGAILYELLSGNPPFQAASLADLFLAIREQEPASISSVRSEVAHDLDIICRKCLEKDPARRYRSAQDLADDLQRWLHGEPITARDVGRAERFWRWCRRRPAVAGLAAAAAVFFIGGLTGIVWQWSRANREAAAATDALHRSEESLWQANLSEARARRISRERGQRTEALRSLAAAASHRATMALRNEAIAALALPDIGEPDWFCELPAGGKLLASEPTGRRVVYAAADERTVLRDPDGHEFLLDGIRCSYLLVDDRWTVALGLGEPTPKGYRAGLWRLGPGEAPAVVAQFDEVHAAGLFPDGSRIVLVRGQKSMEIRETDGGSIVAAADCRPEAGLISVSPDGRQAALTFRNSPAVELWSLDPPALRQRLPDLPSAADTASWHPRDGTLCVGALNIAYLVRPALNTAGEMVRCEREGVIIQVHPSGLLGLITSWDGSVRATAWGLPGELLRTTGFRPAGFSADGLHLAVHSGRRVGVSPVIPSDVWRVMPVRADEDADVCGLEFSPDSRMLAVASQQSAAVFEAEFLNMAVRVPLAKGSGCAWTPEGELLVTEEAAGASAIRFTSGDAGALRAERRSLVAFTPDSRNRVLSWDFSGVLPRFSLTQEAMQARGMALSSDGTGLLVRGVASVFAYDLKSRKLLTTFTGQEMLGAEAWSPDRRWVVTGYWNNIKSGGADAMVFDASSGRVVQRLTAGSCRPAFTPDGRRLILGSTHEYVEYESGTWRELRRHPREASGLDIGLFAFSASANLMVLQASESVLRLLRLDTGEELARLEPPSTAKLHALALSPDGRWLACEARKVVRVWDLRTMREHLRRAGLDWE